MFYAVTADRHERSVGKDRPRGDSTLIYLPAKPEQNSVPPAHHSLCYFHCAQPEEGQKKERESVI